MVYLRKIQTEKKSEDSPFCIYARYKEGNYGKEKFWKFIIFLPKKRRNNKAILIALAALLVLVGLVLIVLWATGVIGDGGGISLFSTKTPTPTMTFTPPTPVTPTNTATITSTPTETPLRSPPHSNFGRTI